MTIDILQGKVDEVGIRVDGDGVCVRQGKRTPWWQVGLRKGNAIEANAQLGEVLNGFVRVKGPGTE